MKPIVRFEREEKEKLVLFSDAIDKAFKFIDNKRYEDAINYSIKNERRKHYEQLKKLIKNKVGLEYRKPLAM